MCAATGWGPLRPSKRVLLRSWISLFHWPTCTGCTPNSCPIWLTVFDPVQRLQPHFGLAFWRMHLAFLRLFHVLPLYADFVSSMLITILWMIKPIAGNAQIQPFRLIPRWKYAPCSGPYHVGQGWGFTFHKKCVSICLRRGVAPASCSTGRCVHPRKLGGHQQQDVSASRHFEARQNNWGFRLVGHISHDFMSSQTFDWTPCWVWSMRCVAFFKPTVLIAMPGAGC